MVVPSCGTGYFKYCSIIKNILSKFCRNSLGVLLELEKKKNNLPALYIHT